MGAVAVVGSSLMGMKAEPTPDDPAPTPAGSGVSALPAP